MSFHEFATAAEMRDVIEKIAAGVVRKMRPDTRVAQVVSINSTQLTAEVKFTGDEGSMNARYGLSLMPKVAGVIVRVAGKPGDYYITEILNDTGAHADYEPVKTAYDNGELGGSTMPPGGWTSGDIADGAITRVKLENYLINADKIEEGAISNVALADGAVTYNKLSVIMGGGNTVPNSGAEVDTNADGLADSWSIYTGLNTPTLSTDSFGTGYKSQQAQADGVTLNPSLASPIGPITKPASGTVSYIGSCWVKGPAGQQVGIWIKGSTSTTALVENNTGLTGPGATYSTVAATGGWQRLIAKVTVDATSPIVGLAAVAGFGGTPASGTIFKMDAVQIELGDVATQYNPKVDEILPGTIKANMFDAGAIVIGGTDGTVTFAPGYDPSTKATITDLSNVDSKANNTGGYAPNPFFDTWPDGQAAPTGYITSTGVAPTKETSIIRTAPYSLRYSGIVAGANTYIQPSTYYLGNSDFVTITADVYLVSGTWDGSGVLVRWRNTGGGNYDAVVDFSSVLSGKGTGSWYRVQQVVQRPSGWSGTFQDIMVWPMGGYSAIKAITAKDIIFDQMNARSSTTEEIKAWTAGLWTYPGTTRINGGLLQTGTVIADDIQAGAVLANSLNVTGTLTVGTAGAAGTMQSFDFANQAVGWQLNKTGFTLKGGTIVGSSFATQSVSGKDKIQLGSDVNGNSYIQYYNYQGTLMAQITGTAGGMHLNSTDGMFDLGIGKGSATASIVGNLDLTTGWIHTAAPITIGGTGASQFNHPVNLNNNNLQAVGNVFCAGINSTGTVINLLADLDCTGVNLRGGGQLQGGWSTNGQFTVATDLSTQNLYITTATTTTNAVNTNTNGSGGRVLRSTASAENLKFNIRKLEDVDKDAYKSLELIPSVFNYHDWYYDNPDEDVPGFIADRAWDLGLEFLVQLDEYGGIETFRYDRLPIYHQLILRKHHQEMAELKTELAELKELVMSLV